MILLMHFDDLYILTKCPFPPAACLLVGEGYILLQVLIVLN